ncbi:MAG TPA: hypothetical protein VES40_12065 [Ilumatobacteraceae bacterium]|nr:hypothetical protein [Ilumatobacteraceae bacterium]
MLAVAFEVEMAAAEFVSPSVSAFFGAADVTPVVMAINRRPQGPRSMVLFLPAFYLLVPGATGLIDVTESVSSGVSGGDLTPTMVTVVAIALGVLFATAAVDAVIEMRNAWRRRPAR